MKNLLPKLNGSSAVDVRKITKANMDNVMNMINNLIRSREATYNVKLIGALALVYNRIQIMLVNDPDKTIRYLKLIHKWYIETMRGGIVLKPDGIDPWDWDIDAGVPSLLDNLLKVRGDLTADEMKDLIDFDRYVLGLLNIHRVIVLPVKANYSTITKGPGGMKTTDKPMMTDFVTLGTRLGITSDEFKHELKRRAESFRYQVLSSSGPNGQQTWTAQSDAKAWVTYPSLMKNLKAFCEEMDLVSVYHDLIACVELKTDIKKSADTELGKIVVLEEWGGKTRLVAECDYWSQMILTPLHDTINHFLRRLVTDGTFNQDRIAEDVRLFTADPDMIVNSYDLSNATDRLPVALQEKILASLVSDSFAANWRRLVSARIFITPDGKRIQYGCGQPMGIRTSFPMLALTHHYIVQQAARNAGHDTFYQDYRILGDDNTMCGSVVSSEYLSIMRWLDVPVNVSKSVTYRADGASAAEICKRVFIEGVEVTTVPTKLLAKVVRDGKIHSALQDKLVERGFPMSSKALTRIMWSCLDPDSFRENALMNVLPREVCGLSKAFPSDANPLRRYSDWFPGVKLDNNHINGVFTYTAAVESLKRLDALLRNTVTVTLVVADKQDLFKGYGPSVKSLWEVLGVSLKDGDAGKYEDLVKDVKGFTANHPIIKASEAEIVRITELLSGLLSYESEMFDRARRGLLDLMRNALTDVWIDQDSARGQGNRTLINLAMANMSKAINNGGKEKDIAKMMLEYTIVVPVVNKLWTVTWSYSHGVQLNMVKSKVRVTTSSTDTEINAALGSLAFDKPKSW